MVIIHFTEDLPANEDIVVDISYTGRVQEDMAGFYRRFLLFALFFIVFSFFNIFIIMCSVYTDNDGNEHWLASTQFESTSARLAFPCFDEPDKKATFVIELNYKDTGNTISLSNMPVVSVV